MKDIKNNINFLRNFVKKRETYIRFSPIGTALMGCMYIIYYVSGSVFSLDIINRYVFLGIGVFSIIVITALSLLNSEKRGEDLLPSSIRYILINLFFIACSYFLIIGNITYVTYENIVASAFIFYGLLIITSRMSLPRYIKHYGFICFILGALSIGPLVMFTQEIVLIGLGIGHIILAFLLQIDNEKNA